MKLSKCRCGEEPNLIVHRRMYEICAEVVCSKCGHYAKSGWLELSISDDCEETAIKQAATLWNGGEYMNYLSECGFELEYAHDGDAGMDLRSAKDTVILPGGRETIGTGIHIELPKGTVGYVMPRSGLAKKYGITVLNAPGVVDEGYRGEIMATIYNAGFAPFEIRKGDRIAQLVIAPYANVFPELVDELGETERGENGFGSTGIK